MNESKDLTLILREAFDNQKGVYDTVGNKEFGTFALMRHQRTYYVINTTLPKPSYVDYPNQQAAGRAWGHLCERFERWWIKQHAED